MNRRRFLRCLGVLTAGGVIAGCSPASPSAPQAAAPANAGPTAIPTLAEYTVATPPPKPATAAAPTATPAVSAPQPAAAPAPGAPIKLTLLHTNDSRGYIDPCG